MKYHSFYPSTTDISLLLSGKKTMICAPLKPQPEGHPYKSVSDNGQYWYVFRPHPDFEGKSEVTGRYRCPFGSEGDYLWGRETWEWDWNLEETEKIYFHKQNWPNYPMNSGQYWLSPATMPKCASRIWLRATGHNVVRVQEIEPGCFWKSAIEYSSDKYGSIRECWRDHWVERYGQASWDRNDWLWIATVELIDKPLNV